LADNSFTHLVVVGSSAGGIAALSGLVSSLPDDFDAPIVVAQHLDPSRESHLQEILARKSPLPVKTVTEHEPLQAGLVFVVPANRHVNITDSEIDLSSEPATGLPMPSINLLMETAAKVYGENLIAIVLSGTGTKRLSGSIPVWRTVCLAPRRFSMRKARSCLRRRRHRRGPPRESLSPCHSSSWGRTGPYDASRPMSGPSKATALRGACSSFVRCRMAMTRDPTMRESGWNPSAAGSRGVEIMRLEQELAETRARERRARHEAAEMRERFERLLDASKRFTRTLSDRRRQLLTSRQHLLIHHAIDGILAEATGLEDAAAGVVKTLGEKLGWQVTVLWVAGEEMLRCIEVWHKPNAAPDGFEEACLRTRCVRGEGLPGIAWAENRPVWSAELPQEGRFGGEADSPAGGLRSVLAFPITGGGGPHGIIEILGSEVLHRDEELHYTVWLVGRRIGQFVDRWQSEKELYEAEERLRLATRPGTLVSWIWTC